jgi:2-polyprenyl-3-methyl-5-hydroxy-6-metoxy-1,4-benzoquinol methylase
MDRLMIDRVCPICGKDFGSKRIYKRNYDLKELREEFFSARRLKKHTKNEHNDFRRCSRCGLVYSSPFINPEAVNKFYKKSKFFYGKELSNIKRAYGVCLTRASKYVKIKGRILDVGTGNGFFLEVAKSQGWKEAKGIEPGAEAADQADPSVRDDIIVDILKEGQFEPESFDIVTFFHVLDHLIDPRQFIQTCKRNLKPGGVVLCVTHDVGALPARIMGDYSFIVDVEHTQLFDKSTIRRIFESEGFRVREIFDVTNTYSLDYWLTLTPMPYKAKMTLKSVLKSIGLLDMNITIKPGNMGIVAQKMA